MDIGILLLRALVGLTVAAHGAQKLFGVFGGHGISGTTQMVESLGFRPGRFFAYVLGIAELVGGVLFAVGLFTPVAAVSILAVMAAATVVVHLRNGFFATEGGFELPFVIATAVSAIAFTGPGEYSWDSILELPIAGTNLALMTIALGIVGGLSVAGMRHLPQRVPFRRTQTQS